MLEDGYRICSIDRELEEYCEQTCGISAEGMMDGEESSEQGRYIVEIAKKNGVAMETRESDLEMEGTRPSCPGAKRTSRPRSTGRVHDSWG